MGATTTHLTSLLKKLKEKYPTLQFEVGEHFLWSPENNTVTYQSNGEPALLLHEVAHALLAHTTYERDVQLVAMERAAWEKAREISISYDVTISEDLLEGHLDTYRDWLHARSTCPACTATGYQSGASAYTCPACTQEWHVNEARVCQLRRVKI